MQDSLGDRMKYNYEDRYRIKLTRRMPVIIRLDGKGFHTLTKYYKKPYDMNFIDLMDHTTMYLTKEIQGCKLGYCQSDEISLLLIDYDKLTTQAWFDYNLQKIVSVSAAMASVSFSHFGKAMATFDARAFNIPREEVCNYFIWRQKDWIRNSVQMLAQAYFSQSELQNKKTSDMHEMLHEKGLNWANLSGRLKNGFFVYKNNEGKTLMNEHIILTENRSIIENLLLSVEE